MGKLINVDNGGTLTDICVIDGAMVYRTKTLTTPHDLSRCLLDGLRKASRAVYGEEDLVALLASTDHLRYSTTQGTNALVERKGPRLGLLLTGTLAIADLRAAPAAGELFDIIIGGRVQMLDAALSGESLELAVVQAINALGSAGANRIVVAGGGTARAETEALIKRILLRRFPQHLLGAMPILYSQEVVEDADDVRRTWTALFNAFLHPAMERFLYSAEHQLREHKAGKPLLIFRNDGHSARVAKTIALKTYSSGPRGGMEGARSIAAHYGYSHLLSMDVGGTTTDIGEVRDGAVRAHARGRVEGIEISFPLCDVASVGVGGSSIIRVVDGAIVVGPHSVGSAPGPACFGLGGVDPTITDAFLVQGLLDPTSFFGGDLHLDVERARAVIADKIAAPLACDIDQAAASMEQAWVAKVAGSLQRFTRIDDDTVLAAFGGGGPFVVCKVAEAAGIRRVLIPGLAAVFSAFGLGFSDIGHRYEAPLATADAAGLRAVLEELTEQARRGMYAEGFDLADCEIDRTLQIASAAGERQCALPTDELPDDLPADAALSVSLQVCHRIAQPELRGGFAQAAPAVAVAAGQRSVLLGGERRSVPLYRAETLAEGAVAEGPAVLEESFFTCRIDPGWRLEINASHDILLTRIRAPSPAGSLQ